MNKAILIGRLGRDPESKNLDGGRVVCKFSIATSERYKDKNGTKVEHTEWHNIEVWDKLAEVCAKYLKKGSQIMVEGKLKTEQWEKDGVTRYNTKIVAKNMQMLDSKPSDEKDGDLPF